MQYKGSVHLKYFFKGYFEGHFPNGHYLIHLNTKSAKKLTAEMISQIIFYQNAFTAEIIFLSKIKELSSDKGIASGHFRISLMNCKTLRISYQEAPMHGKTYQTCSSELQTYEKY